MCARAETLRGAIQCPADHYMRAVDNVRESCERIGDPCPDEFDCYCKPCVKAFEVSMFEYKGDKRIDNEDALKSNGCAKMSLCASFEQTKTIKFRAYDNLERVGAVPSATMHIGKQSYQLEVVSAEDASLTYEFEFSHHETGIGKLWTWAFLDSTAQYAVTSRFY